MGQPSTSGADYLAQRARDGDREAVLMICERVQPVTVTELVEFIHPDKYRLEPGRFDVLCDIFDAWSCDPALAAR